MTSLPKPFNNSRDDLAKRFLAFDFQFHTLSRACTCKFRPGKRSYVPFAGFV